MNAKELYEEWTEGESTGVRPQRAKELRTDIKEYTGYIVPRNVSAIESWIERYKGQVTRKLKEAAGEATSDEDADTEEEQ